jgi:hypothetical protein
VRVCDGRLVNEDGALADRVAETAELLRQQVAGSR